ncbi:MAG: hypothetical protein VKQ33_03140 [Candidatus Sericytochromatia bacterium]|nr:hypothetical protein [Candidatus Sericytochromatia bacterium]
MELRHALFLLVAGSLLGACRPAPPAAMTSAVSRASRVKTQALAVVSGSVRVPPWLLSSSGAGVISNGGARIVANNGGAVVANQGARYALRQSDAPLPGARVYLANARGEALNGLPEARTDAEGRFRLERVPQGLTYVLVAEVPTALGSTARLTSLAAARPSSGAGDVRVGLGSTLATAVVVDPTRGLGTLQPEALATLASRLEARLTPAQPPDLTDTSSVQALAEALLRDDEGLRAEVDRLRGELGGATAEEMQREVTTALTEAAAFQEAPSPPAGTPAPAVPASASPGTRATAPPSTAPASAPPAVTATPAPTPSPTVGISPAPSLAPSSAPPLPSPTPGAAPVTYLVDTDGAILDVAFAQGPSGATFASVSRNGAARIRLPENRVLNLVGHTGSVSRVAFSPDGTALSTVGSDKTLRLWDVATGGLQRTIALPGSPNGVVFSPDGLLVGTAIGNQVHLWRVASGLVAVEVPFDGDAPDSFAAVAFSPDGARLAGGRVNGTLTVWNASTGARERSLPGHTQNVGGGLSAWNVSAVAFSPDSTLLASCASDQTVKLWNAATGELLRTLAGHQGPVTDVAFSPGGGRLVSASTDGTLRLWNVVTGELIDRLAITEGPPAGTPAFTSVAFGPDGQTLCSGSNDGGVRIWEVPQGSAPP